MESLRLEGRNGQVTQGSYILFVDLEHPAIIRVGSLGLFDFEEGTYAYCGSALNGLEGRLARHFSDHRRKRWHIDYLLDEGRAMEALVIPSTARLECFLNRLVASMPGSREPVRGFGSSDCRCSSHLHLLSDSGASNLRNIFSGMSVLPINGMK